MFVALDVAEERAVAGPAVAAETDTATAAQESTPAEYECLFCGMPLTYTGDTPSATAPFEHFEHDGQHDDCCANANVSWWHRLGQEVVAKTLYNWLPGADQTTQVDVERRIGTDSEFVIADIRVIEPIQLAVEVVYLNPKLNLRRRLQTLFDQGYAAMVVLLTNGVLTPASVERSLTQIGRVEMGRFNPHTTQVHLGSVITPERITLEPSRWATMPAHLA